jgi:WD40 repeat protein
MEPITTFLTTTIAGNLIMGILGDTSAGKIQDYWNHLNLGNHDLHGAFQEAAEKTFRALEISLTPKGTLRSLMTGLLEGNLLKTREEKELAQDFSEQFLTPFLQKKKLSRNSQTSFLKAGRWACRFFASRGAEILSMAELARECRANSDATGDATSGDTAKVMTAAARETFHLIQAVLFSGQHPTAAPDQHEVADKACQAIFDRLRVLGGEEVEEAFRRDQLDSAWFFELLEENQLFMNGLLFHLEQTIKNNQKVANILQEYRWQEQEIERGQRQQQKDQERRDLGDKLQKIEQAIALTRQTGLDAASLESQLSPITTKLDQLNQFQASLRSWETFHQGMQTAINSFQGTFQDILGKLDLLTDLMRKHEAKLDELSETAAATQETAKSVLAETRESRRDIAQIAEQVGFLKELIQSFKQDVSLGDVQRQNLVSGISPGADFDLSALYDFNPSPSGELGRGAVGIVYRATHKGTRQPCALKVLRPEFRRDQTIVTRFLREGVILKGLDHPNIVRVEDIGGGGPRLEFFIQMELLAGKSLRALIDDKGLPTTWAELAVLARQLCDGVERIHQNSIIHRDINPNNIMVLNPGIVKLMDFGVARIVGLSGLTMQGQVLGTSRYMSPEQMKGEALDFRTDLFSLGMVLYEMLTGRLPETPLRSVRQYSAQAPDWMDDLLQRCLAPGKDQRFQSVTQLRRGLEGQGADPENIRKYEEVFYIFLEDGKISKLEENKLQRMREELHLPASVVSSVEARIRRQCLDERSKEAQEAMKSGDLGAAAEAFGIIVGLDPEHKGAREALAKLHRPANLAPIVVSSESGKPPNPPPAEPIEDPTVSLFWAGWNHLGSVGGFAKPISQAVLSQDHRSLFTAGNDGFFRQWDVEHRTLIREIPIQRPFLWMGRARETGVLITANATGILETWDPQTLKVTASMPCRGGFVNAGAVTRDGRFAVMGHPDKTVRIWDLGTGEELHALPGHEPGITRVGLSPDERVITAAAGKTIFLWNFMNGKEIRKLEGSRQQITAQAISADGRYIAGAGLDGIVIIWNLTDGTEIRRISLGAALSALTFSVDSLSLIAGFRNRLRIFDTASGREVRQLKGSSGHIQGINQTDDGKILIATGSAQPWDSSLHFWSECEAAPEAPEAAAMLMATPEKHQLALREVPPPLQGLEATLPNLIPGLIPAPPDAETPDWTKWHLTAGLGPKGAPVTHFLMAPDEACLLFATSDGSLHFRDLSTVNQSDREVSEKIETRNPVTAMALRPDGKILATGHNDASIRLWDHTTRKEVNRLNGSLGPISALAFLGNDGLVSGGEDGCLLFWNLSSGVVMRTIDAHPEGIRLIVLTPDGRQLMSAGREKGVRIWDVVSGRESGKLDTFNQNLNRLAVHPDGECVAMGLSDGSIRLVSLKSGEEIRKIFTGMCQSLLFFRDGRFLAMGSFDRSLRIIDTSTMTLIRTIRGFSGGLLSMQFSRSGHSLIGAGISQPWDYPIRLFSADTLPPEPAGITADMKSYLSSVCSTSSGHSASVSAPTTASMAPLVCAIEQVTRALSGGANQVFGAALSPDSKAPLDWATWQVTRVLSGGANQVFGAALSPDGSWLAALSMQGLELWNLRTNDPPRVIPPNRDGKPNLVSFSPDGMTFLGAHPTGALFLNDVADGTPKQTFLGHMDQVTAIAWFPDGQRFVSGGVDGLWKIWETASGREIRSIVIPEAQVNSGFLTPDGERLLFGVNDGSIGVYRTVDGREENRFQTPHRFLKVFAISPDGRLALTGATHPFAFLIDIATGKEHAVLKVGMNTPSGCFFPDFRHLILASQGKFLQIWDYIEGKDVQKWELPTPALQVLTDASGSMAVSVGSPTPGESPLRIWGPAVAF